MTKEQFLNKWHYTGHNLISKDLDAVIAHEIAKVQEVKAEPTLNPIEQAYHNYKPIRWILWNEGWNIKKHSDTESIDRNGQIYDNKSIVFNFDTNPEEWELYTEPTEKKIDPTDEDWNKWQLTKHPAKQFDKDRFEAMFRAVVASGRTERWEQDFKFTEEALAKLDAYYASKEGGANE